MSSLSIVSPTPSPTNATARTEVAAGSDANPQVEFLALALPVVVIIIVLAIVLGAYRQRTEHGSSSLCQIWRRRINHRCSAPRQLSNSTNHSVGHITPLRGGSSAMLVEELTDINTDVWDADCDCLEEDFSPEQPIHSTNYQNSSSSSNSDTCVCTISVEVHSDPTLDPQRVTNDGDTQTLAERRGMTSLTLATCTDDDVSTQILDISSSNITLPSCYSARSTSVPSLTSQNTDRSSETPSSSATNVSMRGDVAQEIVDVVQSDDFARDTAAILHSGSSQFSLFTSHESRGYHTDTELSISTPTRVEGGSNAPITPGVSKPEPEQMIIPLSELDGGFGSSIVWEDWEQELHTML